MYWGSEDMDFEIIEMSPTTTAGRSCSELEPDGCEYCGHCVMLRAMWKRNLKLRDSSKEPADLSLVVERGSRVQPTP